MIHLFQKKIFLLQKKQTYKNSEQISGRVEYNSGISTLKLVPLENKNLK